MKYKSSDVSAEDCEELRRRRRRGADYGVLSEEVNCSIKTAVICILGKCNHNCDEVPFESDKPWTEEEVVEELFVERDMFFTEMADLLGCHPETARNWVLKHDVSVVPPEFRTSSKTVRMLQRLGEEHIGGDPEADLEPLSND